MRVNVVEQHAFTQRQIAERNLLGAELLQQRVEQDRAGDHQVGAPRIETGQVHALLEVHFHGGLTQPADGFRADAKIAHALRDAVALHRRRHGAERQDGSGGADHPVETLFDDVLQVAIDFLADELGHLAFITAADRIGVDESLGQADDADLEAARQRDLAAAAARDLDAAAADVDHHGRLRRVDAVDGGQVNQPRLLDAADDPRANAGAPFDRAQERAAVLGFARRAGRHREDLVDLVGPREPREFGERLQRGRHRLRRSFFRRARRRPAGPSPFRDR